MQSVHRFLAVLLFSFTIQPILFAGITLKGHVFVGPDRVPAPEFEIATTLGSYAPPSELKKQEKWRRFSNRDGSFQYPIRDNQFLLVRVQGYPIKVFFYSENSQWDPNHSLDLHFDEPGISLHGRVVTETGEPLSGVKVTLVAKQDAPISTLHVREFIAFPESVPHLVGNDFECYTDEEGCFTLIGFDAKTRHTLYFQYQGYSPEQVEQAEKVFTNNYSKETITMTREANIYIYVDRSIFPKADSVLIRNHGGNRSWRQHKLEGNALHVSVRPGSWDITLEHRSKHIVSQRAMQSLEVIAGRQSEVFFDQLQSATLLLTIVHNGQVANGWLAVLSNWSNTHDMSNAGDLERETDESGTACFENVPFGHYFVQLHPPGWESRQKGPKAHYRLPVTCFQDAIHVREEAVKEHIELTSTHVHARLKKPMTNSPALYMRANGTNRISYHIHPIWHSNTEMTFPYLTPGDYLLTKYPNYIDPLKRTIKVTGEQANLDIGFIGQEPNGLLAIGSNLQSDDQGSFTFYYRKQGEPEAWARLQGGTFEQALPEGRYNVRVVFSGPYRVEPDSFSADIIADQTSFQELTILPTTKGIISPLLDFWDLNSASFFDEEGVRHPIPLISQDQFWHARSSLPTCFATNSLVTVQNLPEGDCRVELVMKDGSKRELTFKMKKGEIEVWRTQ